MSTTTHMAYRLVSCDLNRTPNFIGSPAEVVDGQLNDKALDLQLFENTGVPLGTSGALWLAHIARLKESSQFSKGLDGVVCAGLCEVHVGGKQAVDAGFVSLSLRHVLSSLDEAADVLGHLQFNDVVVRALEIVGVADGERQVEARVLVLYDLVKSLELLGQHLLVDFHDFTLLPSVVLFDVWVMSPGNNGGRTR